MSAEQFNERPPHVDGQELEDGYGIQFATEEVVWEIPIIEPRRSLAPEGGGVVLVPWLTKRNWRGEYEKHTRLPATSAILCWDNRGRAWEYERGVLTIHEDKLDLDKEYEDE